MGKNLNQYLTHVGSQAWDAQVFLPALFVLWIGAHICTWIEMDKPQPLHGMPPASQTGCHLEWLILRNKFFLAVQDNATAAILVLFSENSELNSLGNSVDSTFSTFPSWRLLINSHPSNFMPGPLSYCLGAISKVSAVPSPRYPCP